MRLLLGLGLAATGAAAQPRFNNTECPRFWEMQTERMKDFRLDQVVGYYYELAFHDVTQYPLCFDPHPRCITANRTVGKHADGVVFMDDDWNLGCFGQFYPQDLIFNKTEFPGYFKGYVPVTKIPGLPKGIVANVVFPNTMVDFKDGPDGWSLEFQCVEHFGRVLFIGINFYAKQRSEAAFQEMLAVTKATGIDFYAQQGFGLKRVDHTNCSNEPGGG